MKALIFGITGQDGSYMAELLLVKGYEVTGVIRRSSTNNLGRINHIKDKIKLVYGDVTDGSSVYKIISEYMPNEIYNFAAQSYVKASFDVPEYSGDVNAIGTVRILEAVKTLCPKCKIYNACTSEMFGNAPHSPQNEDTNFNPVSPYGASKLYSYHMCNIYREAYGLFVVNGICFNHESPRRGEEFVTKKIVHEFISNHYVKLGNIYAKRDWGYAKEYVEGMWMSLQQTESDNYVFATEETHSVKEFCEEVLNYFGFEYKWENNKCVDTYKGRTYFEIDDEFKRPKDVNELCGKCDKAKEKLGWEAKTKFKDLVKLMVEFELYGKE